MKVLRPSRLFILVVTMLFVSGTQSSVSHDGTNSISVLQLDESSGISALHLAASNFFQSGTNVLTFEGKARISEFALLLKKWPLSAQHQISVLALGDSERLRDLWYFPPSSPPLSHLRKNRAQAVLRYLRPLIPHLRLGVAEPSHILEMSEKIDVLSDPSWDRTCCDQVYLIFLK